MLVGDLGPEVTKAGPGHQAEAVDVAEAADGSQIRVAPRGYVEVIAADLRDLRVRYRSAEEDGE